MLVKRPWNELRKKVSDERLKNCDKVKSWSKHSAIKKRRCSFSSRQRRKSKKSWSRGRSALSRPRKKDKRIWSVRPKPTNKDRKVSSTSPKSRSSSVGPSSQPSTRQLRMNCYSKLTSSRSNLGRKFRLVASKTAPTICLCLSDWAKWQRLTTTRLTTQLIVKSI